MSDRELIDPLIFGEAQRCFGCGPRNDVGMQLRFFREGDSVVTTFSPRPGWEGPPGIVHGGLQATLADELGAWTVVGLQGCFALTASLQLRYLRPARMSRPIEGRGWIVDVGDSRVTVRLELRQGGEGLLSGTAAYVTPTVAAAEALLGGPLPEAWIPLARPG
ncbi:MAG TPA: PaaI family thioesterase [Deltaproteobacteria bacterium]|nr:PaaI family thioesterase [Deltaproteobacteria bacterium]